MEDNINSQSLPNYSSPTNLAPLEENHGSNWKLWVLIGLGILIVMLLIIFLILSRGRETNVQIKDYGTNIEGFIKASKNCEPSKVNFTQSLNIFGTKKTTDYILEINGLNDTKCVFTYNLIKVNTQLPSGASKELKDRTEKTDSLFKGMNKTCKYSSTNLTSMLEDWKSGTFSVSTEDDKAAECTGGYIKLNEEDYDVLYKNDSGKTGMSDSSVVVVNNGSQPPQQAPKLCTENWQCTEWSSCNNTIQMRECTDSNNCGGWFNKPSVYQPCQQSSSNASFNQNQLNSLGNSCNYDSECTGTCENCQKGTLECVSPETFANATCRECGDHYGGVPACKEGFICSGGKCLALSDLKSCVWSTECGAGLTCFNGRCVIPIKAYDSLWISGSCKNCVAGYWMCNEWRNATSGGSTCTQCLSDTNCVSNAYCEKQSLTSKGGICRLKCTDNSGCKYFEYCENMKCIVNESYSG